MGAATGEEEPTREDGAEGKAAFGGEEDGEDGDVLGRGKEEIEADMDSAADPPDDMEKPESPSERGPLNIGLGTAEP